MLESQIIIITVSGYLASTDRDLYRVIALISRHRVAGGS